MMRITLLFGTSALVLGACTPTYQGGPTYDRFSAFEAPLSTDLGGTTVSLRGLIDQPFRQDFRSGELTYDTFAAAELRVETKLPNRWRVGAGYLASTEADYSDSVNLRPTRQVLQFGRNGSDTYQDGGFAYVQGGWGRLEVAHDVDSAGRVITRRAPGAGNAYIDFDNFYGGLSGTSLSYTGRYSAYTTGITVDEDGHLDAAVKFERPIGRQDYNLALRGTTSEFVSDDGLETFDTMGARLKGEIIYGSTLIDAGLGYERLDGQTTTSLDRYFLSSGLRHKSDAFTWSLEGMAGQVDGQAEYSAALGASYDMARGLSLNFGLNYSDAHIEDSGIIVRDREDMSATTSLRYTF